MADWFENERMEWVLKGEHSGVMDASDVRQGQTRAVIICM